MSCHSSDLVHQTRAARWSHPSPLAFTHGVRLVRARYRRMMQYYFRHASQRGFFYRVDHAFPAPELLFNFTNPLRDYNMYQCLNKSTPILVVNPYPEPDVLDVMYTVWGPGRLRPSGPKGSAVLAQRQALWDAANDTLAAVRRNGSSTHVPSMPSMRTDMMPYV